MLDMDAYQELDIVMKQADGEYARALEKYRPMIGDDHALALVSWECFRCRTMGPFQIGLPTDTREYELKETRRCVCGAEYEITIYSRHVPGT